MHPVELGFFHRRLRGRKICAVYGWFIAYKYLVSRFITFAALLTVASGVALLIVILSVMEGFRTDLQDRIRGTSSDIRIESRSLTGLKDPFRLKALVERVPGVRGAVPSFESLGMCRPDPESEASHFFLQALDLRGEALVGHLDEYLSAARKRAERDVNDSKAAERSFRFEDRGLPSIARQPGQIAELLSPAWLQAGLWEASGELRPRTPLPPVLVGYEAMQNFSLFLGRTLRLTSYSPVSLRARSAEFVVAGVFLSRDYQYDSRTIVLPLDAGADFLELRDPGTRSPGVSCLRVAVADGDDLEAVEERIRQAVTDVPFLRVRTWKEEKASLLRAVRIEKTVVWIILGVLILFAGFMIFIVLTVQVVEKARDLGILQSIGSTSRGIARIYLLIGSTVCFSGTVLGSAFGVAFSLSIDTIQRWLYLLVGFEVFPRSVYYIDRIPVRVAAWDLAVIIAPTVLISLLFSVIPAYWAARKDPVVALRYE